MKPVDIHLYDLQRIFIGEVPPFFFIELVFRAAFVYILLILSMRFMGKPMSSQISRNEMAAVVSLAAAVGIPLMNADRGLLPGVIIAIVIIIFHRIISYLSARYESFEAVALDEMDTLVMDGVLDLKAMKETRISRERLFAQLRSLKQKHLGSVKRLYLEANGLFSLVVEHSPKPGLSLIPETDHEFLQRLNFDTNAHACKSCGYLTNEASLTNITCPNCKQKNWVKAAL